MSRRRAWRSVMAAVAAGVLLGGGATGATASAASATRLAFAGPDAREVRLVAGTGELTVRLRNGTARAGSLRVAYLPSRGTPRATVRAPGRIGARGYAVVRVRLALPADQGPERLDGLLIAGAGRAGTARLRIRGAGPRIALDPRKLELSVDRYGPLATGGTGEVVVRGPDAPALARARTPIGAQVLTDGDAAIRVAVGAPKPEDGVFVAPVEVQDAEGLDTGSFSGTVPVSTTNGAEALSVEVKVGFSFLVMALVVLLGSILGGFAQRYSEVGRDARILRLRLKAAVADYDAKLQDCPGKRPASYALDTWLDPRPQHQGFARYPGTRGVAGMQWHLGTARTKRDVDDQRFRVRAVVRHVERWLTLEPVARAAAELLDERPSRRGTVSMLQCRAFKDVRRLLDDARAAPDPAQHPRITDEATYVAHERREDQASAELARALAEQTVVLDLALQAWCFLGAFDRLHAEGALDAQTHAEVLACELSLLEDGYPPLDARDARTNQQLRLDLHDRVDRLAELWPADREPPRRADGPTRATQLERVVRDPSRTVTGAGATSATSAPTGRGGGSGWRGVVVADWTWTILTGLVSAVLYALGVKAVSDGTWGGSLAEYATAFATGFGGEAVAWRSLPRFRGKDNDVEGEPKPPSTETKAPPEPEPTAALQPQAG